MLSVNLRLVYRFDLVILDFLLLSSISMALPLVDDSVCAHATVYSIVWCCAFFTPYSRVFGSKVSVTDTVYSLQEGGTYHRDQDSAGYHMVRVLEDGGTYCRDQDGAGNPKRREIVVLYLE